MSGKKDHARAAAILAIIAVSVLFKFVYMTLWLGNNDNFITLSTFYKSEADQTYQTAQREFYTVAVAERCTDESCKANVAAVLQDQTYSRAIIAFAGSFLAAPEWLASREQFLTGITRATIAQIAVSTAISVLLLLAVFYSMPAAWATVLAGFTALYGICIYWLPSHPALWKFQPFLGLGLAGAAAVIVLAVGAWWYSRSARSTIQGLMERRGTLDWKMLAAWLWGAAVAVYLLRLGAMQFPTLYAAGDFADGRAGVIPLVILLAGVCVFLAAIGYAALIVRADSTLLWLSAILLFGFVSIGETFFATMFHIAPRGYIYLLAAPIIVYVALRPNGWAVWLLPLLTLFHVPVAGLLFGCILATELVTGIRSRRLSVASGVAGLAFAGTALHSLSVVSTAVGEGRGLLIAKLLSWEAIGAFLPGIAIFALLAVCGYLAWRTPGRSGDLLLRAVVLATLLAGAGQLRETFLAAGYHLMETEVIMFTMLWYYLSPIVCASGIFLVLFALASWDCEERPRQADLSVRAIIVAGAGILALMAGRSDYSIGRPPNPVTAVRDGLQLVVTNDYSKHIDPLAMRAASPDDHYYVGWSPGDAISTMSILKMKTRAAAGLLQPENVVVESVRKQ